MTLIGQIAWRLLPYLSVGYGLLAFAPPDGDQVKLPDCNGPVSPSAVSRLTADVGFYFDTENEVLAFGSPPGMLKVTREDGPITIRDVFIDSGGKKVTKKFARKNVYRVEPADGAKGRAELIVVAGLVKTESQLVRRLLDVDAGGASPNPPGPTPDPNPPGPTPPPVPAEKLAGGWIVLVEETELAQSGRAVFLSDPRFLARRQEKGIKLRSVDQHVVDASGQTTADVAEYVALAKQKRQFPQVFFVASVDNGRKRKLLGQFDLPKSIDDLLALMTKYGG